MLIMTDESGRIIGAGVNGQRLAKSITAMVDHQSIHKPQPRPMVFIRQPKPEPRKALMKAQPAARDFSQFDSLVRDLREVQVRRRINGR